VDFRFQLRSQASVIESDLHYSTVVAIMLSGFGEDGFEGKIELKKQNLTPFAHL